MHLLNSLLAILLKMAFMLFMGIGILLSALGNYTSYYSSDISSSTPLTTAPLATSSPKTTPPKTATTKPSSQPTTKKVVPVSQPPKPTPPPAPVSLLPTEQVDAQTRAALVNILCVTKSDTTISSVSGSGVFIDSRGVILTNAHVAQYFLLHNYPHPNSTTCTIRTGSPARATYTAKLLYLPPVWIDANASQINATSPKGTGEDDYAFLVVNSSTQAGVSLPSSFAALPLQNTEPNTSDSVLLAAYPAGFLTAQGVLSDLYILSSIAKVQQLYTFDSPQHVDVISVGGTAVSQSGSSGGAVVELSDAKLTGIIVTDGEGSTTSSRILNAITLAHINRSLSLEGQGSITALLSQDLNTAANNFNQNIAPGLLSKLAAVLKK